MTPIEIATTMKATSSSELRVMLGHDLIWWRDLANLAMVWSLIAGAVSAAGVVVSTVLVLQWEREIKRHDDSVFERYKLEVAGRVADAEKQGIKAGIAASDAQGIAEAAKTEIAKQEARAASFEKDAADARLQTERLRAQLSWRTLSPQQIQILESVSVGLNRK